MGQVIYFLSLIVIKQKNIVVVSLITQFTNSPIHQSTNSPNPVRDVIYKVSIFLRQEREEKRKRRKLLVFLSHVSCLVSHVSNQTFKNLF